jgi:DNA-directed RNA polymerase specialized sigma24 family protein
LAARSPETFTFSYLLTGGIKNLKIKLFASQRNRSANISYIPYSEESSDTYFFERKYPFVVINASNFQDIQEYNEKVRDDVFEKDNPEKVMLQRDNDLKEKERIFNSQVTDFQKEILRLKRDGKTIKEISESLGCSITTVKNHTLIARTIAVQLFNMNQEFFIEPTLKRYEKNVGKRPFKQIRRQLKIGKSLTKGKKGYVI